MELLRFATCGSVDDGKSTLIGRLLFDSKAILQDTWDAIELSSKNRGDEYVNLALITDGLRAEREQGITIDVAYRYFATPRRKFIIADTPGHVQYTRNMVTGASTAHLALILIDARQGILEQSRRHAIIASLLGIPHLVVCVNKMDLVDNDRATFERIRDEFALFARKLQVRDIAYIPISALKGDNVVDRSEHMPWYEGPALLRYLEEVEIALDEDLDDPRFPVQYVIRPMSDAHHDYRGYAGTVAGGVFRPGDAVRVLPSGLTSRIRSIDRLEGAIDAAVPPMAVTVRLEDDLDISRGDMIVGVDNSPHVASEFEADVCWMAERSQLTPGTRLAIKQTTRSTRVLVRSVESRLDVNSLDEDPTIDTLRLNEIGRVRLRTTQPLFFDPYQRNRLTGSFILIDEATNNTVAAGMIRRPLP
ncbi:MAG: GTP-binding protein [Chloroflexi bacterium]|nr:GTP-binding protein [Chloroflexota bacterium]MDA1003013.1 GTP-binding protein [Chloroflexota bacterium]